MNKQISKIKLQPIRYYKSLICDSLKGIDLTVGEGHFNCPFNAKLKVYEALLKNNTKYSPVEGSQKLREMVVSKYYPLYDKDNEIIITNGATQGLFNTLMALINSENDEIIIIGPYYPAYLNIIKMLGAKAIIIDSSQNNFRINNKLLDKHITENTRAIIINEPNNPTGVTYNIDAKKELLNYFNSKNIYIIIDEIYKVFTDNNFISFSSIIDKDLKEKFIFINGLSKSHMMTGFRIGFVLSNKEINKLIKKVNYLTVSCVSTIMQEAAVGALNDTHFTDFVSKYYLNNLSIVQKELDYYGINYVKATSGYYIFMNTTYFNMRGLDFCTYFSKNYQIALVPGYQFGDEYEYYVRISCCKDIKDIVKFLDALKCLINKR